MYFVFCILATMAVVQAAPYAHYHSAAPATLVRAPQHDSAIVRSDRFGGNFAYSIAQRHAYQAFAPQPSYNYDPFYYSHHHYKHRPFAPVVPGHHFYIKHTPIYPTHVPSFLPAIYTEQHLTEEPTEATETPDLIQPTELIQPVEPLETFENSDADSVSIGNGEYSNGIGEETTEENDSDSNDVTDDSITIEAF